MKLDHIGIAVRELKAASRTYEMLGLKAESIQEVSHMKVKVAFFEVGDSRLELLEPSDASSPIAKFLDKKGEGVHHICFEVANIEKAISDLKQKHMDLIYDRPQPGAEGSRVTFIHPKSCHGVLIELKQKA